MKESRGSASAPATGMAVGNPIEELYISIFGIDGPQHDSEARSEHRIPKAPAKFREYEKDNKYFDPRVVSLGPYHHGEDHVTLSQMEESRGIASSPATRMAEETVAITREAVRDPSDQEWFISIIGEDGQQPDPEPRPKLRIPKVPTKFREYEKDKKYFDPQVVSLGPYHHHDEHLKPMEDHKMTATKRFGKGFLDRPEERSSIYQEFIKVKQYYTADGVAYLTDDDFVRMMTLDGCFVLNFILNIMDGNLELEISNDDIPLIIRDMFLMENQLPFEVLDKLMNLGWGSSNLGKQRIVIFIVWKVLKPMGFYSWNSHRLLKWCAVLVHRVEQYDSPLHLLDILRTILLDFPTQDEMVSYNKQRDFDFVGKERIGIRFEDRRPRNFSSVMELKEIGIRFENRRMKSLMDISFKENLLFPRLFLPTMYINDTTISQLLNLTAFEACSDTYSGFGVSSYIHFMDSLINDGADVKMLRSKGILHHSLGSDDELAGLFNTWPANVTKDLKLYSDISTQLFKHRKRKVKISIATWWDKYFGSPWTAISFVAAVLLLFFTAVQTYFAAFSRR